MVVSNEHQPDANGDTNVDAYADANESARKREIRVRNRRTGFIVATIALAFFIGIIVKYTLLKH